MKVVKGKNFRLILQAVFVIILVYLVASLVNLQVQKNRGDERLAVLKEQVREQELKNQELERLRDTEDKDEYIEKIARDELGMAYPEERVIVAE